MKLDISSWIHMTCLCVGIYVCVTINDEYKDFISMAIYVDNIYTSTDELMLFNDICVYG